MKTLIVYYSYTRSNEELALRLQRRLHCDVLKVEEVKKRNGFTILFDLLFRRMPAIRTAACAVNSYDHVIAIAPIWASRLASPLVSFLHAERANIRRYSFITFCGGVDDQKEKIAKQLAVVVGKDPVYVTELWLKNLPLSEEHQKALKWNSGYVMNDRDMQYFEPAVDTFIKLSGVEVPAAEEMHEAPH